MDKSFLNKNPFSLVLFGSLFLAQSLLTESSSASTHTMGSYKVEFGDEQGFTAVENLWGVGLSLVSELSKTSGMRTNVGVYDMDLNDVHFENSELKQHTNEYYDGRKKWLKQVGDANWIGSLPFQTFSNEKNHVEGYKIGFVYELSGVKQIQSSYYLMCEKRMFHLKTLIPFDDQEAQSQKIEKIVSSFRCERDASKISGLDRDEIQKNWKSVLSDDSKKTELPAVLRDFLVEYEISHQAENEDELGSAIDPLRNFIRKYFSGDSAWAVQAECFFAGWPSNWSTNEKGAITCSAPRESQGCPTGELKCNPAAFGNVCIDSKFKSSATQICNSEFNRNSKTHSAEIIQLLKTDKNALGELASTSEKICESETYANSNGGLCKTLLSRVSEIESGGNSKGNISGILNQAEINPADYDKAYDSTQNEAQIFEQYCTEKDSAGQVVMVSERIVNGKHLDCLAIKNNLLINLRALDKIDSKTNFKSISAEACDLTPFSVPQPGKGFSKQLKALACSSDEAKARTKGQCGEDILCSV